MPTYDKTSYACGCGGKHTKKNRTNHINKKRHIAWVAQQQITNIYCFVCDEVVDKLKFGTHLKTHSLDSVMNKYWAVVDN